MVVTNFMMKIGCCGIVSIQSSFFAVYIDFSGGQCACRIWKGPDIQSEAALSTHIGHAVAT